MEGKLSRCAQLLQTNRPEPSSPADPNSESLGCPALFLLMVQIKWQNAQPPPGPPQDPDSSPTTPGAAASRGHSRPFAARCHPCWLHYCCPCRRVSELLCIHQLSVPAHQPALARPLLPALSPEGRRGLLPPCVAGLAAAGSVGKGEAACLGRTARSAIRVVSSLIPPLLLRMGARRQPPAPKVAAVMQRRCREVGVLPSDTCRRSLSSSAWCTRVRRSLKIRLLRHMEALVQRMVGSEPNHHQHW